MLKVLRLLVPLLLIVSALIIVPPRLWVKNKTAKVIYNGQLSEKVKLFHGSGGRLLFFLAQHDPDRAYIYSPSFGLWRCENGSFANLKLIAISKRTPSGCAQTESGTAITGASVEHQALQFRMEEVPVTVSWQAAPR